MQSQGHYYHLPSSQNTPAPNQPLLPKPEAAHITAERCPLPSSSIKTMATELPEADMAALCVAVGKAMAVELPEAGMVAVCTAIGKTMATELPEAAMVALLVGVAIGCTVILMPLLSFLVRAPARGPVLAAVLFITLALPMAYIAFVILLYTPVTAGAAAGSPVALAAFQQYVLLVCAPLVLLFMPFLFLAAGGC